MRDALEPFADLERHGLAPVVDRRPGLARTNVEAGATKDERPVGVVLELGFRIDAAGHADVALGPARLGDGDRLADAHRRRGGQQPTHAIAGAEGPQHERADQERTQADQDRQHGDHGRDPSIGQQKTRRNLPDTWALMRSPPLVSLGPSGLR